jgi:hypothetical protein
MSNFLDSILPAQSVPATITEPRSLLIYSDFKVGKSMLASDLSSRCKALWLDYESGSAALPGVKLDVIEKVRELQRTDPSLKRIAFLLKLWGDLAACNPPRYDVIIHDKLDNLEDWAVRYATAYYKNTVIGRNFTGDTVLELPEGSGYSYLREKFLELWNAMIAAAPRSVFFTSLRMKYVGKGDNLVDTKDLDLTGKVRKIAAGFTDAPAYLRRVHENGVSTNYLSFKTAEAGTFCGCRVPWLEGKEIKISEKGADGVVKVYWEKIYPSLFPATPTK